MYLNRFFFISGIFLYAIPYGIYVNVTPSEPIPTISSDFARILNDTDPIESNLAIRLKEKIMQVYSAVKFYGLYISNNLLEFNDEGDTIRIVHFPSAIISANLVNRSSTLVSGPSGSGKTSTIRYIDRLINGTSITKMENIIHCDKEIQKEDWIGFLNPKNIINGNGTWEMEWAEWTDKNTLIIDEIQRANRNMQNALLLLMNDGRIQYGVRFSKSLPHIKIFMTENPYSGILHGEEVTPLTPAFLDRITQRIYVESPSEWAIEKFSERRRDEREWGYDEDGVIQPLMKPEEVIAASILASKMPIDSDANKLAIALSTHSSLCIRAPLYTKSLLRNVTPEKGLCEGCDFKHRGGYCRHIYGGSLRIYKDLIAMGKAYAFWLDLKSVTKHLIRAIAPDIISHRIFVSESALREDAKNTFGDDRKFIERNYIDYEFGTLSKTTEVSESFNNLLYGKGNENDLKRIKNYANENLSVRIEKLPMVTIGIDLSRNVHDGANRENYSCLDPRYKKFMSLVNSAYKKKNVAMLIELLNRCGTLPMGNLVQDIIHEYLHKLNYLPKD